MILTRQQTETIYKVCNLLDCDCIINGTRFVFGTDNDVHFSIYMNGWDIEVHSKKMSLDFESFPTFEQLKPILDLIPII